MMRRSLLAAVAALLGAAPALAAESADLAMVRSSLIASVQVQDRTLRPATGTARVAEGARGWIGINAQLPTADYPGIRVTTLMTDGPAHRAGLRAGDFLVRVNGSPASRRAFEAAVGSLVPGAPIVFTVRRGDQILDVAIEAEARPEPETLVTRIVDIQMDSARAAFEAFVRDGGRTPVRGVLFPSPTDGSEITVVGHLNADGQVIGRASIRSSGFRLDTSAARGWVASGSGGNVTLNLTFPDPESARPLVTLIQADSTRRALSMARARLVENELATLSGQMSRLRTRGPLDDEGRLRLVELERAMSRARTTLDRERSGLGVIELVGPQVEEIVLEQVEGGNTVVVRRPLAPYVTGLNRVAGAELRPMNADLATYFQVDEGLIVTDVTEGSPGWAAGLRSGDIVASVNGRGVGSVDEVRKALAIAEDGWVLQVVRRGDRLEIRLR